MEFKCSICLDSLFSVNTDVSVTQCGHLFHKTCLEGSLKRNRKCPNCKCKIKSIIKQIYPDVFDILVYNSCSNETFEFFQKVSDLEKERKIVLLKVIKKLDKENRNLKETNKKYKTNLAISKAFLETFQKDRKEWQEKSVKLELENNNLLNEIRKLNIENQFNDASEDSVAGYGNEIKSHTCEDSSSNIEALHSKSLLSLFNISNSMVY